jgi:hypothetical protein
MRAPAQPPAPTTRRQFIAETIGAGALLSLAAPGCAGEGADAAPRATPPEADTGGPSGPLLDPEALGLPYRQNDPEWSRTLMWDRELVIRADTELNGQDPATSRQLLARYPAGNTIGNEGCMLTCLAMVMRLLADPAPEPWTPAKLNARAQARYYYTLAGLSMVTLYADLVSELSRGEVQLYIKEEHLPGMPRWTPVFAGRSPLIRAYRSLPLATRANLLLMLKTGTYDDTRASHYVLLHPNDTGSIDEDDLLLLDPAMPLRRDGPWRLSDSSAWITGDPAIARAWEADGIGPLQIAGAWVFSRRGYDGDLRHLQALAQAWAEQMAAVG